MYLCMKSDVSRSRISQVRQTDRQTHYHRQVAINGNMSTSWSHKSTFHFTRQLNTGTRCFKIICITLMNNTTPQHWGCI